MFRVEESSNYFPVASQNPYGAPNLSTKQPYREPTLKGATQSTVDQIGQYAQKKVLEDVAKEAKKFIADLLGVKSSSTTVKSEAENVIYNLPASVAQGSLPEGVSIESQAEAASILKGGSLQAEAGEGATVGLGSILGKTGAKVLGTVTNVIGAAYSIYDLISNWGKENPVLAVTSGATAGAAIGSMIAPGVGTLVGAGIGGLVGALSGLFGSGKSKDQKARDGVRDKLLQAGVIDQKWSIGLADGSRYDIGVDGGQKTELGGRRPYEIDFQNPLASNVIGYLNPLIYLVTGGDKKLATDFVGYFTNAALSNAGGDAEHAKKNVLAIYSQFKISPDQLVDGITAMAKQGMISEAEFNAFIGGIKSLLTPSVGQKAA